MEEDKVSSLSVEEKRPIIVHAFRRSSLRKKIAEYLYEISPSSSYPSEIASCKIYTNQCAWSATGDGTEIQE